MEKKKEICLSPMTKTPENSKCVVTTQNANLSFDYTTIVKQLKMVNWSSDRPTATQLVWLNRFAGAQPLTTKAHMRSKGDTLHSGLFLVMFFSWYSIPRQWMSEICLSNKGEVVWCVISWKRTPRLDLSIFCALQTFQILLNKKNYDGLYFLLSHFTHIKHRWIFSCVHLHGSLVRRAVSPVSTRSSSATVPQTARTEVTKRWGMPAVVLLCWRHVSLQASSSYFLYIFSLPFHFFYKETITQHNLC